MENDDEKYEYNVIYLIYKKLSDFIYKMFLNRFQNNASVKILKSTVQYSISNNSAIVLRDSNSYPLRNNWLL